MSDAGLGVKFQRAIIVNFPRANPDNENSPIAELRAENPPASAENNQTSAEYRSSRYLWSKQPLRLLRYNSQESEI